VIDQNAESAVPCRREIGDDRRQVVDPVQGLDHHPLDPQIMTPDLLDQLRIMDPFDVDARGQCDRGPVIGANGRA
jgi:hypothetical protein